MFSTKTFFTRNRKSVNQPKSDSSPPKENNLVPPIYLDGKMYNIVSDKKDKEKYHTYDKNRFDKNNNVKQSKKLSSFSSAGNATSNEYLSTSSKSVSAKSYLANSVTILITKQNRDKFELIYPDIKEQNYEIDLSLSPVCRREWLASQLICLYFTIREMYSILLFVSHQDEFSPEINGPTNPSEREPYPSDNTRFNDEVIDHFKTKYSKYPSALEYISEALKRVDKLIKNKKIFPTKYEEPFQESFIPDTVPKILRLLLTIVTHFYTQKVFLKLQEHQFHLRLNKILSHLILVVLNEKIDNVVDIQKHCLSDLISVLCDKK